MQRTGDVVNVKKRCSRVFTTEPRVAVLRSLALHECLQFGVVLCVCCVCGIVNELRALTLTSKSIKSGSKVATASIYQANVCLLYKNNPL